MVDYTDCNNCTQITVCCYAFFTFDCDVCHRAVPWCMGAEDDMPGACSECYYRAHERSDAFVGVPQAVPSGGWGYCRSSLWWIDDAT
jgi:hypothetical protein